MQAQITKTLFGKKIRAGILITVLLFQVIIWVAGFVTEQNKFADVPEIYIPVRLVDPYDQFRGSYLALNIDETKAPVVRLDRYGSYWVFTVDENNFVTQITRTEQTPGSSAFWEYWAEDFSVSRYYAEESEALEIETQWWNGAEMWLAVLLSNGEYRVNDLIIR